MARKLTLYDPEAMLAEARRQRAQVASLAASLDDATFVQRPDPARWSVGECVEHLAMMNRIYLEAIDEAVSSSRAAGLLYDPEARPARHGRLGDLFVRTLEPPPGRLKVKTFDRTTPQQRSKAEVLPLFLDMQDRLIRTIDEARDIDFARARMRSPLFRALKLTLGQAFGAVLAHNRRHIWQAEGVLALLRTNPRAG